MITLIFYVLIATAPFKDGPHVVAQTYVTVQECEEAGNGLQHDRKGTSYVCRPLAVHVDNDKHTVTTQVMM